MRAHVALTHHRILALTCGRVAIPPPYPIVGRRRHAWSTPARGAAPLTQAQRPARLRRGWSGRRSSHLHGAAAVATEAARQPPSPPLLLPSAERLVRDASPKRSRARQGSAARSAGGSVAARASSAQQPSLWRRLNSQHLLRHGGGSTASISSAAEYRRRRELEAQPRSSRHSGPLDWRELSSSHLPGSAACAMEAAQQPASPPLLLAAEYRRSATRARRAHSHARQGPAARQAQPSQRARKIARHIGSLR